MLFDDKLRKLNTMAYADSEGRMKFISKIYQALADGNYQLIWKGNSVAPYVLIRPKVVWVNEKTWTKVRVESNTNWRIE